MGDKWIPAIVPMQLLAIAATFRSIQPLIPQVLVALRESRRNMDNTLLTVLVLPLGFYGASRWGINGVAIAWLILYPLLAAPLFGRTFRMIDLPVRSYLASLWPATSSCLVMAALVTLLDRTLLPAEPSYVSLFFKVFVGAAVYAGSLLLFHRPRILALRALMRLLRTGKAQEGLQQEATKPEPV